MHIKNLNIQKYKVLENIEMDFQVPQNGENALNVIAGVNGCGKTSLLELIADSFTGNLTYNSQENHFNFNMVYNSELYIIHKFCNEHNHTKIKKEDEKNSRHMVDFRDHFNSLNEYKNGKHSMPRVIYIPNKIAFTYKPTAQISTKYQFVTRIVPEQILGNAELYIKEYIIGKERQSTQSDPEQRTREAVDAFNRIFGDCDFVTRLVDLDRFNNNRPVFETITEEQVTIDQLSDGEKQLYGRVVSLMLLNPHDSVILIDEPEIGLHPKWQYSIMDMYKNIGTNNQFIIATHSPHILARAHYKELILLKKADNRIRAEQFDRPPSSRDINEVLAGIMEARYMPDDIRKRHERYRQLVETGQKDSPEAKKLLKEILEHEPEESEFMQRMRFYEELNA